VIKGRKGLAAAMDAMLFITVLGLAASAAFVYFPPDDTMRSAESVCGDLLGTELRISDVFGEAVDFRVMPLADIIAMHILTGKGDIETYVHDVIRSLVPVSHGFVFECTLDARSFTVSERAYGMTSSFETSVSTYASMQDARDAKFRVRLEIH